MSSSKIHFFSEETKYKVKHKAKLRAWITHIATQKGYTIKDLNYIICSDEYLLKMNQQYLDHDTYTDVITFDHNPIPNTNHLFGDIFISIDRIKDNADKLSIQPETELHRVMIHGALHLMGHLDKSPKEKALMTQAEDQSLSELSHFL